MNKEIEIPEGYEARIDGNKVIIEPKESDESYDFEITDRGGFKIGTLSLEKDTGEVYLFDSDNVVVSSVKKN